MVAKEKQMKKIWTERETNLYKNIGIWLVKAVCILVGMKLVLMIQESIPILEVKVILLIIQLGLIALFIIISVKFARKHYIPYLKAKKKDKEEER